MESVRYRLAPWLEAYDRLGHVWHPYLMAFHAPEYDTPVVRTDGFGFRMSARDGERFGGGGPPGGGPVSLLVGGSVAFGVGATSDAATIPSLLGEADGEPWLNYGGKAISATQELLLFLLHRHRLERVRRIVFFSGANELVMAAMGIRPAQGYAPFFFHASYDGRMNRERPSLGRRALEAIRGRRGARDAGSAASDDRPPGERAIEVYERTLETWGLVARALGAELSFVLQPIYKLDGQGGVGGGASALRVARRAAVQHVARAGIELHGRAGALVLRTAASSVRAPGHRLPRRQPGLRRSRPGRSLAVRRSRTPHRRGQSGGARLPPVRGPRIVSWVEALVWIGGAAAALAAGVLLLRRRRAKSDESNVYPLF